MATSPEPVSPPTEEYGGVLAAISRRIVQLHKEYYGKGPERAKTYYQDDVVVVVLRGGFSRVEETLLQAGRADAVIEQRAQFQDAMQGSFRQAITELTGREVQAFMSGSHQDPDVTAEVFLLAPNEVLSDEPTDAV